MKFPVTLEVTPCSLDQLDPTTNTIFASYNYKDIDGIIGNVEGITRCSDEDVSNRLTFRFSFKAFKTSKAASCSLTAVTVASISSWP